MCVQPRGEAGGLVGNGCRFAISSPSSLPRRCCAQFFSRASPDPLPSPEQVARVFGAGLVRDGFVSLLLTCPMLLWFALLSPRGWTSRWRRGLLGLCLSAFWMVQIFLIFAEYFFFEEFRSRFNTVAIDYLLYPHEVFVTFGIPTRLLGCWGLVCCWPVRGCFSTFGSFAGPGLQLRAVEGGCSICLQPSWRLRRWVQVFHSRVRT